MLAVCRIFSIVKKNYNETRASMKVDTLSNLLVTKVSCIANLQLPKELLDKCKKATREMLENGTLSSMCEYVNKMDIVLYVEISSNVFLMFYGVQRQRRFMACSKDSNSVQDPILPQRTTVSDEFLENVFFGDGSNKPTNWEKGEMIKSGGFGPVFEVVTSPLNMNLDVKQVIVCQRGDGKKKAALLSQLANLKQLSHPRLIQFYGFCEAGGVLSLFMDRLKRRSLHNYLKDDFLDERSIKSILRQILEGVSYLHSKLTIHRDIKGENILLDENFQIKLADFGVSKIFQDISLSTTMGSWSIRWMAPEMFYPSNDYSYGVDIWATGCTVVEMLTRNNPFFDKKEEQQVVFHLMSKDPSPAYALPETCPLEIMNFLKRAFETNPSMRPHAKDILLSNLFPEDGKPLMKHVREDEGHEIFRGTTIPVGSNYSIRQIHQARSIQNPSFSGRLRPQDEEIIRRHWNYMMEELDATLPVIDDLIFFGVLYKSDKQEIINHSSRKIRTEIMLEKLFCAGSGPAFGLFLNVIKKHYSYIADKLRVGM